MNSESIKSDFDQIARLADQGSSGSDRFDRFLVSLVPLAPIRILDVGCGSGRLSLLLARNGNTVHGVDFSSEMILRANRAASGVMGVTFSCVDFLEVEFDAGSFDCVISAATLHHLPLGETLEKMIAILKPGGRLIIHDLRSDAGFTDVLRSNVALLLDSMGRLVRTGSPRQKKEIREAWELHGVGEVYLTYLQAKEMAARYLPQAEVYFHWLWRYTIVWDRPNNDVSELCP